MVCLLQNVENWGQITIAWQTLIIAGTPIQTMTKKCSIIVVNSGFQRVLVEDY